MAAPCYSDRIMGMLLVIFGRVDKLALGIAAQVNKMGDTPVSGNMRTNSFPAFYALEDKRTPVFRQCGFPDCQSLFNGYDVPEKFTLRSD